MFNIYFDMLFDLNDFMIIHYESSFDRHQIIKAEIFSAMCLAYCQGWCASRSSMSLYIDKVSNILKFIEKSLNEYYTEWGKNEC